MARKKKIVDNSAEQYERLNSKVRVDGVGEDPVVRAILSEDFVTKSNVDAFEISLALQELIRGQNSMLSMQDQMGGELSKLRGRMDSYDKDAKKWENNRKEFMDEVNYRAKDLLMDDKGKQRLLAQEAQHVQEAIQRKMAETHVDRLKFEQLLQTMPKETILPVGKFLTVSEDGVIKQRLEPEVIKIKHHTWVLQPGVPAEVPTLVADEWRARHKLMQENVERKALMNADRPTENMIVAQKWGEINKKYQSGVDAFKADSR